jgi:membrane associated rhomboid family serine protease
MMLKTMKYLIPAVWLAVWLLGLGWGDTVYVLGYRETSSWLTHFTYVLCHNGLAHLALNAAAFIVAYNLAQRFGIVRRCMLWSFAAAVAGTWPAMAAEPTVGGSGFVYAMFGFVAGHILSGLKTGRYMLNPERIRVWMAVLSTVSLLAVPFFAPGINASLHLWCFALSLGGALLIKN